jgi:hypothetical protein
MPEKRSFPIWDVVQALAGVYCGFVATASWLYPQQIGQPNSGFWNGIRVTLPPLWATGFALVGIALLGKASSDFVRYRRDQNVITPPPPKPKLKIHSAWYGTNSANDVPIQDFLNSCPKEALSVQIETISFRDAQTPHPWQSSVSCSNTHLAAVRSERSSALNIPT